MANEKKKERKQAVKKSDSAELANPFDEMERLFERRFGHGWLHPLQWEWPSWAGKNAAFAGKLPSVDVIDRDDEVIVRAELPGVDKKDLDITVSKNAVTIKGSTSHEDKEEKGDYYRCEISRGSYSRTLALPAYVDEDKARAEFKNGILNLTLPKTEKTKRRSVKVD